MDRAIDEPPQIARLVVRIAKPAQGRLPSNVKEARILLTKEEVARLYSRVYFLMLR